MILIRSLLNQNGRSRLNFYKGASLKYLEKIVAI